ncbi:MAG: metal-dependent hydrolase [Candidatus Bathycorpusculaceae bacterium]
MEPLIHFVVPFTALTLVGVKPGKALPVSLLAVLPDLDALFLVHRSLSHSLIVVLGVMVPLLLLTYKFKPRFYSYGFLALTSIASHLALDLFAGYTPILWPLYGYSVWIQAGLVAHVGSPPSLALSAQLLMEPITFQQFQSLDAPLFTGEGLVLTAVLLMPVFFKAFKAWWQRAGGRELVSD